MSPQKHRRTFISYSRINKEFAVKLAKELKTAGFPVWLDQLDIPTGSRWDDELEKALRECPVFMVILTPASIASENVKDEIGYAIDHGKRILPVLLEDCDVPLRLRRFQYVDFTTKGYEDGIQSAMELLGNLVMEDSVPVSVVPPPVKLEEKVPVHSSPLRTEKAAQSVSAPSTPAQPVKKNLISKPLMIGIGVGALLMLTVCVFVFGSLLQQPDLPAITVVETEPPLIASESESIPVSGDSACPAESSQPVEINVENFTALAFDYYWIDFDCQLQYYGTLDAFNSVTLSTYVSHIWEFHENQSGDLFLGYVADGGDYLALSGGLSASGVTGFTVSYVYHGDGEFVQGGDQEWVERSLVNGEEIYFEEIERDEWSVYLYDPLRNINIQLDLWTRAIIFDGNTGQEPFVLYSIIAAE